MFISKALRVFIVIYQEGSIKAAADRLYLTVPPVMRMLKLTEEWLGAKLFTIDKNKLVPTKKCTRIYHHILPHYVVLADVSGDSQEQKFIISSPCINLSAVTNLIIQGTEDTDGPVSLNRSSCIHDNDDLFLSLEPVPCSQYFTQHRIKIAMPLICAPGKETTWQSLTLLVESEMQHMAGVDALLAEMSADGFTGVLATTDNTEYLKRVLNKGLGIGFQSAQAEESYFVRLPYHYEMHLFIYVNEIKKSALSDKILSNFNAIVNSNPHLSFA